MADDTNFALPQVAPRPQFPGALRIGLLSGLGVLIISLLAALFVPKGFALAVFGDTLQSVCLAGLTILAFQNFQRSHYRIRIFWFLIFVGALLWTISNLIWSFYELWYAQLVPDVPAGDILLFVKVVPLTAAALVATDPKRNSRFSAIALLDVFILMLYSLYLYAFGVFAYRLLPQGLETYNFRFNVADGIANLILIIVAAIAALRSQGQWRVLFRLYFLAVACYGLTSVCNDVAIDMGRYYTGSLYDIPLIASLVSLVCVALAGRTIEQEEPTVPDLQDSGALPGTASFVSSHLAMLVALSTPVIGILLLSSDSAPPQLRPFRIGITLVTILLLTLLLSVKQDFLTTGLLDSLSRLFETYNSIDRFKTHLAQSEKLAALGELVAQAAKQIKGCMTAILDAASRLVARPDTESRIQHMAGKIGQYTLRTDLLVENMLHFAQETPLQLAPMEVRPIIESALHLSRIAKLPNVSVDLAQEGDCPLVRGDASQLLHVFVQLISNAVDALEEAGGGAFDITIRPSGSQLLLEFADSGPGLKEPQRVFEPFYTTKPVGKGTGLGLSMCYGIIQQHEGEISCRNRPEGGAIFAVLLPLASESVMDKDEAPVTLLVEGVR
jgi:signal transduction histidine kinase